MTEDEPREVDLTIPPPPERADLRTRVFGLTRRLGEEAGRAASMGLDAAGEVGERAARLGRAASAEVGSRAQRAWMPDDPVVILGSATFAPFPAGGPPAEMLSIAWQSDALVALSALGVTQWEREIVTVTRSVFHDNLRHQELSRRLFGSDFDAIHRWIDTVPGSGIRGGGIVHRLQHGHDLAAVRQLYDQHGLPGVLVWMQHVAQDVCTPTGIPIPLGGPHIASWLVDSGFTTPGKAALMLSFNAAQLASTVLGGAFALRLATLAAEFRRQRQVARRCAAARDAWARGDLDAVVAHYSEARSLSNDDPTILMSLGWAYAQMGRPAVEAFLAFRAAAHALAKGDRTTEVDGAALSLRGLAYMLALSHAVQVLEETELRGAWRAELDRMLRGAIAAFERTALAQTNGPAVRVRDHELALYRQRPLSAAANYYLAARLARSAPFLPSSAEAARLSGCAMEMLEGAARAHSGGADDVRRSADRWRLELAGTGLSVGSA
ncbi:MAG TPA: hypothetical protein VF625_19185 [Longimicrobium sp.]